MNLRAPLINPMLCLPDWIARGEYRVIVPTWEAVVSFDPAPIYERLGTQLDPYRRIQSGLSMAAMWPNPSSGICACGCGGACKQRWARPEHSTFANRVFEILYGRTRTIEKFLRMLRPVCCADCGAIDAVLYVDHIVPVKHGGGAAWLGNYQLLCHPCHRDKTNRDFRWGRYAMPRGPEPDQLNLEL